MNFAQRFWRKILKFSLRARRVLFPYVLYTNIYYLWTCILCIENRKDKRLLWLVRPTSWSHLMEEFCSNIEDSELLDTLHICTNTCTWSWALLYIIIILILFWLYRQILLQSTHTAIFRIANFIAEKQEFVILPIYLNQFAIHTYFIFTYILFVADCQT